MKEDNSRSLLVISPHQDDAALSLGASLLESDRPVTILDVFTRTANASDPEGDIDISSEIRGREEMGVADAFGWDIKLLDFPDAQVRGIAWDERNYRPDQKLLTEIAQRLAEEIRRELIAAEGRLEIWLPAAFGHPDHLTVLQSFISPALLGMMQQVAIIKIYADLPYASATGIASHPGIALLELLPIIHTQIPDEGKKSELLAHYPSQMGEEMVAEIVGLEERSWQVSVAELADISLASISPGMTDRPIFFGEQSFLDAVRKVGVNFEREFVEVEVVNALSESISVPLQIEEMNIAGDRYSVARFAAAHLADYLMFPGIESLDQKAIEELIAKLKGMNIDILWLSNIAFDHPLIAKDQTTDRSKKDAYSWEAISCPGHIVVGSFEEWLQTLSKSTRKGYRKLMRKTVEKGLTFALEPFTCDHLSQLLHLQKLRAVEAGLDAVTENSEFCQILASLIGNESVRVATLKDDFGKIYAIQLIIADSEKGIWAVYLQGSDSTLEGYYPGLALFLELLKSAHESEVRYVDFLRGEEDYKTHLANTKSKNFKLAISLKDEMDLEAIVSSLMEIEE